MKPSETKVEANIVDAIAREIYPARVLIRDGLIHGIERLETSQSTFLLPGFVDAHVHVESSMLVPSEFARAAVCHGTVGTVSDPHEIGNVLGVRGIHYMLDNAQTVPFKFCFGAPPCVPATTFESSGAVISVQDVIALLEHPSIGYLSEVMNFPGVLNQDADMMAKIAAAKRVGKPIDGHAPGLRGELAAKYIAAGISTDHECFTKEEALDKLACGCKIAIREGSAARNFQALYELIDEFPDQVMLCSDDKHPDELLHGHIDRLVERAIALGLDLFNVIKVASLNAIEHYRLPIGRLRIGDPADMIEVQDLVHFKTVRTWIDGQIVAEQGSSRIATKPSSVINQFDAKRCSEASIAIAAEHNHIEVIHAFDGQLVTSRLTMPAKIVDGFAVSNIYDDCLKMVVLNRYQPAEPAVAFIHGVGLKRGAFASSVAHDSHNIIAVGVDDKSLVKAINAVIDMNGGLSVVDSSEILTLPLPIAGLMSTEPIEVVSDKYAKLDAAVKEMGATLRAPFMTLSFMALLVIPDLKLSDLGLFDGQHFRFTSLFVDH